MDFRRCTVWGRSATWRTLCLGMVLWGVSGLAAGQPAELRVMAAASLTDVLTELGTAYRVAGNAAVRFQFGSSHLLARQIKEGAPADVFISADELKMNDLASAGAVLEGSRRIIVRNTLVIIVHAEQGAAVRSPQDLTTSVVRRLALAEVSTVPAGIYAREYFERMRLWDALKPKVVGTENVRATLAAVEAGNADAGVVYRTDALLSKKVRIVWDVTGPEAPTIVYPAAVLKASKHPEGALRWVEFLNSPEARSVWSRHGFVSEAAVAVP